ncbi:hypothetical protein LUZ60_008204 [Juncus effusus]|nr:hypothetical protein LUZ60_008204 [Juncus effusus]
MAWFNSLGGFQDLAGAVNKISESIKNIEKNFDTALGFEEKNKSESDEASGSWGAMPEFMAFMQQKEDENAEKSTQSENSSSTVSKEAETISTKNPSLAKEETSIVAPPLKEKEKEEEETEPVKEAGPTENIDHEKKANDEQEESSNVEINVNQSTNVVGSELTEKEDSEVKEESETGQTGQESVEESEGIVERETSVDAQSEEINHEREPNNVENEEVKEDSELTITTITEELSNNNQEEKTVNNELILHSVEASNVETKQEQEKSEVNEGENEEEKKEEKKEEGKIVTSREVNESGSDSEIEKLRKEMKMMEAKADVMTKLMNENDQLKSSIEDLKRKSSMESEVESLKEEYHQRVSSLERKVYALTKERDTLRREKNKESDAAALLKEKDEIITQVMAEGSNILYFFSLISQDINNFSFRATECRVTAGAASLTPELISIQWNLIAHLVI